jgi:hypothetical protein
VLETPVLLFGLLDVRRWRRRKGGHRFAPTILTTDIARDCIKIKNWIIYPGRGYISDIELDPSERLVGQIFSLPTLTPGENFDQTAANLLITISSLFPIGVKPGEQVIKRFGLSWKPFIRHFISAVCSRRRLVSDVADAGY